MTKKDKKKTNKTKIAPRRVFTQAELRRLYNVPLLRQPRDEVIVFDIKECVGWRLVKNKTLGGAYEAVHWRGSFRTRNSAYLDLTEGVAGLLEVSDKMWSAAVEKLDLNPDEFEPELMTGLYTIEADADGRILSILKGDHLDETLSLDDAQIIDVD